MSKQFISIFFSILFLGLITAPSIIVVVDSDIDISVLYSVSEEEEEIKSLKLVVTNTKEDSECLIVNEDFPNLDYLFKSYTKPDLNLISPPPDYNLL
ncbi:MULTISPECIES: hypothetical protein [Mesoflavibacter]|uniref:Uncharacterized protein n=1 Tax=Mesoflavibacter profundi TaxID=2708110 RepID=A0ABT4S1W3_9FLAO|nr:MULTISPECIES: hypothetical protein [Mesoflavibacter]MDA0178062.1 hypothetical protein [Mesoflavibacter profundi]QIJ89023.1 hypothetical protein C7H62_1214 [Mesoflavibacter sp. HG96]QIJ91751.1 hypothetical protein C7H56_1214 [Mesoflavibacter sp. HG37]